MKKIAESVLAQLNKDEAAVKAGMIMEDAGFKVYPASVHKIGAAAVMMGRDDEKRYTEPSTVLLEPSSTTWLSV